MTKAGKRLGVFVLLLITVVCFAGCGSSQGSVSSEQTTQASESTENDTDTIAEPEISAQESESPEKQDVQESDNTENGSNILVVYFSRTGEQCGVGVIDEGNTAIVAQMIAEQTGADTFEILPVDDHYPMTYSELTDVAKQEQNENARPAYESGVPDLSQYSTIFIGAPVWWGDWPMICYTFFENENLSGKTLYPFSTHAGSGLSGFDRKLASAVPDATVGEGLAIAGTDCQSDREGVRSKVNDWLSGLGF